MSELRASYLAESLRGLRSSRWIPVQSLFCLFLFYSRLTNDGVWITFEHALKRLFSLVLPLYLNKNRLLLPVRNTRIKSLLTFIYEIVKSTAVNPRICHVM